MVDADTVVFQVIELRSNESVRVGTANVAIDVANKTAKVLSTRSSSATAMRQIGKPLLLSGSEAGCAIVGDTAGPLSPNSVLWAWRVECDEVALASRIAAGEQLIRALLFSDYKFEPLITDERQWMGWGRLRHLESELPGPLVLVRAANDDGTLAHDVQYQCGSGKNRLLRVVQNGKYPAIEGIKIGVTVDVVWRVCMNRVNPMRYGKGARLTFPRGRCRSSDIVGVVIEGNDSDVSEILSLRCDTGDVRRTSMITSTSLFGKMPVSSASGDVIAVHDNLHPTGLRLQLINIVRGETREYDFAKILPKVAASQSLYVVAIRPDGRVVVHGNETLWLWDPATGDVETVFSLDER